MPIDLSPFRKALASLDRAIERSKADLGDEELRDAVIQRFEYTYELAWKMLKRCVKQESPHPGGIDALSFRDLLREAAHLGILDEVERWMDYREMRNITAHTYDDSKARQVHAAALDFAEDARALLQSLDERCRD